ncbi:ABC transporter G family member 23 isoform X2 [Anoplophora glabripennis]|nr:ABC transporter G family member 23 isoform X2 [Anoplophora glabripennis]
MDEKSINERYHQLHNLLELPPDERYLKNCSGGQQRRVSLAAALVHSPELLIMDEPTVGVDPVLRDRIWNHLVEITTKGMVSVIITTHYIEECRQAHKIGLMREGRLLAEESPNRLLSIFNTDTLEDVFLILSRRQEEGRLDELNYPVADDQNNSVVAHAPSTTSIATFDIAHGSTDMLTKEKKRVKGGDTLNKSRLRALMDKNWKQFYRNVTGIIFLLTFPIIQITIFMIAIGGDVRDIPLAIVNDETMTTHCPDFDPNGTAIPYSFSSCHFSNMSCRFLTHLDHPMITKVHFNYLEDAIESVKHGKVVGVLYIAQNFTASAEERIEKGKDIDDEVLDFSEIKVWLDMSNRQVGATVKYKLIDLYIDFQNAIFEDCHFIPGLGDFPVRMDFYFGTKDDTFVTYMTPGSLITIIFFMGAIMTSQIIITDRHDGVWDRSIVAGVTSLEITLTHFILQASILVIQVFEMLIVVYAIVQQNYVGYMWLIYFIVFLQGLCGMSYGFWVSVISVNHSMANTVLTGIFLPMMMLSGLMWPTEGMPPVLRILAKCLPFTLSIESLRNVANKGWNISHLQVLHGIGVGAFWLIFFGVVSVYLIKNKR